MNSGRILRDGTRIEIPRGAEWIIRKLRERGFEAFVVGGCVRDAILGREPEDWDITTSATPREIKEIFTKTVDTGIKHGTVTVLKDRRGYEVTTYRVDGEYRDHRHPESVKFTRSLSEDLKRRDFTINAMAYSHETGIVDEFCGMRDLEDGVIRCVGRADDRFSEDALRMLRAIRFSAQLNFAIAPGTYRAIEDRAPDLANVSKERVLAELTKLLLSDYPGKAALLYDTGLAGYVTGGFEDNAVKSGFFGPEAVPCALPRDKSLRMAALLRLKSPQEAVKILRGLKSDNATMADVRDIIYVYQAEVKPYKPEIRLFLSRVPAKRFAGGLALKEMDGEGNIGEIRALCEEIEKAGDCLSLKELAVTGNDLIAAGMAPGNEIGKALNFLLSEVLRRPELNERETLMRMLGL